MTEVPGPKARARVAFDESVTSPSLPRAYPIVPVRGSGVAVEDADGNVFLDFASGIAVTSTGHAHPEVVEAIQRQAAELIHFSASDFYLPIYSDTCAELARIAPISGPQARLPGQQRRRGRRGVDQAGAPRHRPAVPRRLPGRLPRPHLRRRLADRVQVQVPRRLRSAAAGRLPRAVRHGRGPALVRRGPVRRARARRTRSPRSIVEPIQGEGGYVVPEDGFLQGLRELCSRARDRPHRRRDPVGRRTDRDRCGQSSTWGVEPDILLTAKGIASGMPLSANGRARRADGSRGVPGRTARRTAATRSRCAAALATIRLLEDGLIANAAVARRAGDARTARARRRPRRLRDRRARARPDDRRRIRHGGARRSRSSGPASSAACWSWSAAGQRSDWRPRWSSTSTRSRRRCASSARRSPR